MKKMMTPPQKKLAALYERDEPAWLDRSVELIEGKQYENLDFDNLIDFLKSMARRDKQAVQSRLITLIAHLLKWQFQPKRRSRSWQRTIRNSRRALRSDFESATLKAHGRRILSKAYAAAVEDAAFETKLAASAFPTESPYSFDFLVSDELPKDATGD